MSKTPLNVFFFRGISTAGHDNAKFSIFDFGPVHKHISRAMAQRGVHFHPVLGMGAGPLREVAARALAAIEAHPVFQSGVPIHLFGHSAGGLVARLVLPELEGRYPNRVISALTVATPNSGAHLARILIEMPERYRGSHLLLRSVGWDVRARKHFWEELTSEGLQNIFAGAGVPAQHRAATGSIVCWSPRKEFCAPLKLFYNIHAFRDFDMPSDGVVERDTQAFGKVEAEIKIDHFRQVGLFPEGRRFDLMMDVIHDYFAREQARA